jgi:hypothetical protein
MDIEELVKKAQEVGLSETPLSLDEREGAVEHIFTTYQKPLEIEFVKSILSQADIKVPNLNHALHTMKRSGKLKHVSRGVYQATSTKQNIVTTRVHRKFLDSIGKMFSMKDELSQREDDIEKLQGKVDDLRHERQNFNRLSSEGES